ncbi:hypothetical protein CMUS01_05066, partial [Colletotrichum musicola]
PIPRPTLTSLPLELVLRIIELTHPASHLDLACTCKKLAQSSSDILRRHREAHDNSMVSDLLPASIPGLVRALARGSGDSVLAWHVRSLEIWGTCSTWDDWKPFTLEPPGTEEESPSRFGRAASPLEWTIDEEELEVYGRILRYQLHLSEHHVTTARQELEEGDDGILKVLAIALCPHLESVKYVWTNNRDLPHAWLTSVVEESLSKGAWAPGLQSLRKVAVGVNSGTWLDRATADDVYNDEYLLATLVKLPQIDSIYYHGCHNSNRALRLDHLSPEEAARGLTPGSSSLEHLFLHEVNWMDDHFRAALIAAPRALKSFCLRGNTLDAFHEVDLNVMDVQKRHSGCLESLMMYDVWGLNGYRAKLYVVADLPLSDFGSLRHVYVDVDDLLPDVYLNDTEFWEAWNGTAEQRDERMQWAMDSLPASMEVLCIGDCDRPASAMVAEECLVKLLKSGEFEHLRAIYIEDDVRNPRRLQPVEPAGNLYFQRLVEVAERHGVDVVSRAGGREIRNEIDFPEGVEYYHLASGPHARDRDEGEWEFSPFTGRWEPKGCGRCGDCEDCFQVYTREAWQTRYVSTGEMWMVGDSTGEESTDDESEGDESE